ncbi:MAG: hypothetical protein LBE38_08685 [Deltaproteobacteria bacterium]|jgi:hypothetical protein|nr:hypothetical protein [Deltaproteobacteria bacterium]
MHDALVVGIVKRITKRPKKDNAWWAQDPGMDKLPVSIVELLEVRDLLPVTPGVKITKPFKTCPHEACPKIKLQGQGYEGLCTYSYLLAFMCSHRELLQDSEIKVGDFVGVAIKYIPLSLKELEREEMLGTCPAAIPMRGRAFYPTVFMRKKNTKFFLDYKGTLYVPELPKDTKSRMEEIIRNAMGISEGDIAISDGHMALMEPQEPQEPNIP